MKKRWTAWGMACLMGLSACLPVYADMTPDDMAEIAVEAVSEAEFGQYTETEQQIETEKQTETEQQIETEKQTETEQQIETEKQTETIQQIETETETIELQSVQLPVDDEARVTGYCDADQNVLWAYYDDGTLRIMGFGEMTDYSMNSRPAWYSDSSIRNGIKEVEIEWVNNTRNSSLDIGDYAFADLPVLEFVYVNASGGAITLGDYAFSGCRTLNYCFIPDEVTAIGAYAFADCGSDFYLAGDNSLVPWNYANTYGYGYVARQGGTGGIGIGINWSYSDHILKLWVWDQDSPEKAVWQSWRNDIYEVQISGSEIYLAPGAFSGCKALTRVSMRGVKEIGDSVFERCPVLSDVTFGDGLTTIGNNAFSWCAALKSIELPESVDVIGSGAFEYCGSVTRLVLPAKMDRIGEYAFFQLSSLRGTLSIPEGLKEIKPGTFGGCTYINYIQCPDSVERIGDEAFAFAVFCREIHLPNNLKSIGKHAFENCYYVKSFKLPASLKSIEDYAFSYCQFKEISLPEGLETIGDGAFKGHGYLQKVILPNSVTSISAEAFTQALPEKNNDFCLPTLYVYQGSYAYQYARNQGIAYVLVDADTGIQLNYKEGILYISGNQTLNKASLETYAGSCGPIKGVVISGDQMTFDARCFSSLTALETVVFDGVQTIGDYAFCDCPSLVRVNLGNSVMTVGSHAFDGCKLLESVVMTENLNSIGTYAFARCSALKEINLPEGFTTLQSNAFLDDAALETLLIPESLVYTGSGQHIFDGCPKLVLTIPHKEAAENLVSYNYVAAKYIDDKYQPGWSIQYTYDESSDTLRITGSRNYVGGTLDLMPWKQYQNRVRTLIVEGSELKIGPHAFTYFHNLRTLKLSGVIEIGSSAFSQCTALSEVQLVLNSGEEMALLSSCFSDCTSLKEITLPEGVIFGKDRKNDTLIFSGCTSLSEVHLPENMDYIPEWTFGRCKSLTQIDLPETITEIGPYAFYWCSSLELNHLPPYIQTVGANAFYQCKALSYLWIPSSITTLGTHIFDGCDQICILGYESSKGIEYARANGLYPIEIPRPRKGKCYWAEDGNVYQLNADIDMDVLVDSDDTAPQVSCTLVKYYREASAAVVSDYADLRLESTWDGSSVAPMAVDQVDVMAAQPGYTYMTLGGGKAMYHASVEAIASDAFSDMRQTLTKVTFGTSIKRLEEGVFKECTELKTVAFELGQSQLTELPAKTFYGCQSLQTFDHEGRNHITTIGTEAFYGCSALEKLSVPETTFIGDRAFAGCTSLSVSGLTYAKGCHIGTDAFKNSGIEMPSNNGKQLNAVTDLKAASAGKQRVTLTWKPVTGADGYLIYGKRSGTGVYSYLGICTGNLATTWTDVRALDTDYNFYWVYPYYNDANGKKQSYTKEAKYVYAKGITLPVTGLKAAGIAGGVKLSWNVVSGADGYLIYGFHGSPNSGATYGFIGMTGGTSYTDKKALNTEYNYYYVFPYHYAADGKRVVGGTAKYVWGKAR